MYGVARYLVCVCVLQVWEALLTLFFFPICVLMAWIADRRLLVYKYLHRRYRADKRRGIIVETEGDLAPNGIDIILEAKYRPNGNGSASGGADEATDAEAKKEREQEREEVRNRNSEQRSVSV